MVSGAGAGAIACTRFYEAMGVKRENVFMFDSRGLIHKGRTDLNEHKAYFAQEKDHGSLEEVMKGADCFLGLSVKDKINAEMVKSMAPSPMIFACANPDPEIPYDVAKAARPDCVMATGRSDFPNQVNNVLGFPFIFRGALDCRATTINEEMKIAAAQALAALAKEPCPKEIAEAYGVDNLEFGHRLHHSQGARPARADLGGSGRGPGRHGHRRGHHQAGHGAVQERAARPHGRLHRPHPPVWWTPSITASSHLPLTE